MNFLKGLQKNNNKEWFDKHRVDYEAAREYFVQFTKELLEETAKFDPSVAELDPKRCLLRMNRDARFTKNKPPYHNAFRIGLSKAQEKELAPAYYLNYEPGNIFMGGGLVGAPNDIVKKVRQEIVYNWKDLEKILHEKQFTSLFGDL